MTKIYPFKFLDAYALKDKDIFFGREEETEQLYNLVHQSKMVWLYGASGTGKTSLIDCGLANQFKSYDWKAFFIRRGDNFNHSLDKTLCEASEGEYLFNKDKALDQLLKKLETVHILYLSPIYLIFDQLEELYILGSETEQKEFIQAIKQIYASPLPIKMLFSIREEYLGYLYEFEKAVPELLRKKLRVEPMNLDKINHVLNGIDQNPHTNVKLKEGEKEQIAEEIFNKIKGEEKSLFIQLPYLQVFLDRLYRRITQDETHQKEAVFDLASIQKVGDIGNVLRDFLEEQVTIIAKDLQQSPETLWKILSPFATLEGTKEPLSLENLQGKLPELPPHLLDQAVEKFANVRILRYTEKDALYEVSHDTLAKQIAAKRSDEEIALLEIDRLIKNQLAFGKDLFSEKQLDIILPYQNKLKLTKEEIKLIYDSQTKLQRQQKGQKQRTRNERIGVAIFVIILLRVSIFALWQWQITEDALDFAKTMQTKMETAVFDKAVKNRFPEWKSYSNYNSNNSQEKAERDKILGQIDSLDLSGNALTALPQELAQCPRLTHLNLLQNPEIDWTSMQRLKGLPQLHSIYVSVNDLSAIDSSYWKQITGVEILQNGLTAIPENLLAQQQLRYLDLSADRGYDNRNQFFPLPPTLFALQNLNYLNLGSCQIKELPAEIRQLKNLTTLDLRNNQLSRLPVEIGQLKNLTVLRLSGNQLSRLPVEIGQLKNLTVSTLNNNPLSSEQINQTLWLLPNIERLFLGDLGLNQLPEAVFQLSKLKELYLTNYDEDKKNPNTFSEEEKTKIKKLLPNCYVQF